MKLPFITPVLKREFSPVVYDSPKQYKYTSRYFNVKRIVDTKDGTEYHATLKQYTVPISSQDQYFTVDSTTENRLDIVSYRFYGTAIYWWVIAFANQIIDPFKVKIGDILRIPSLPSLYGKDGILSR